MSEKGAAVGERKRSSGSAGEAPAPGEVDVEEARAEVDVDEAIALDGVVIVRVVW